MGVERALYAGCAVAFAGLIALMTTQRPISRTGIAVGCCCALTAAWAAAMVFPAVLPAGGVTIADTLRLSAWLLFAVALVALKKKDARRVPLPLSAAIGFCLAALAVELISFIPETGLAAGRLPEFFRLGFGVAGLLAIENLWRNAEEHQRAGLWPLCLALGSVFAFELFLYADQLMVRENDVVLDAGRAVVGILAVPLLAVAMARNREWRVNIHVSRTAVLHTAALVTSGALFLVLAVLAAIVRREGGRWGPGFQLATLLGSAVVLVSVLGWRDLRVQGRRIISRHFFSHRYDYRLEWLRFLDTVAQEPTADAHLFRRVISALAQIVDSPAGSLWCLRPGVGYLAESGWNLSPTHDAGLPIDDPFIDGFRGGSWIQERAGAGSDPWPAPLDGAWLAIPLTHAGTMIAFALLMPPRRPYPLNWEAFDLLRAAGRQAASYIAEERSTRALLDAQLLTEFSKRFAFVVHDIKNLASQLGLVLANARRHGDDPEFQQDMLRTIEGSVARMNRLLTRLHGDPEPTSELTEPDALVTEVARELTSAGTSIEARLQAHGRKIAIDADRLRSVLHHLIRNASDACAGEAVLVTSRCTPDQLLIDVVDRGPGMDEAFVRQSLFKPFRSTKTEGLGIGAYQAREFLRAAGGDLEVISQKGAGTTMRIILPVRYKAEAATPAV